MAVEKPSQKYHEEWMDVLHVEWWYHRYAEFWENFDDLPHNARIVDMGCGGGAVAHKLFERGFRNISLIDIHDYRSHEHAKRLPFYQVDLNFDTLPFRDASQDFIVAPSLIEHLENPFFFIRECSRVLKPGGALLLTMYIGWNLWSRLLFLKRGIIEGYQGTNYHISFLPKNIFWWLMRDFELESAFYEKRRKIHIGGFEIRFPFPQGERWSKQAGFTFRKK